MQHKRKLNQIGSSQESKTKYPKVENPLRKSCAFLGTMNFKTFTPEKPFEPKLYKYPFDKMRHVIYKTTSLEKNYKHTLFTEPNLGINFDLIQGAIKDSGEIKKKELDPEDIILLSEDTPEVQQLKKITTTKAAWMKKSDPTASKSYYQPKKVSMAPPPKSSSLSSPRKNKNITTSSVEEIEKTFEIVDDISHPTKKVLKVTPLLPNLDLLPNSYVQVYFDSDPGSNGKNAIITQTTTDSKYVSYILPKSEKDENLTEIGQIGDFDYIREYQHALNQDEGVDNLFFLTQNGNETKFLSLDGKIKMDRVRTSENSKTKKPSKVTVELRSLNEKELEQQHSRFSEVLNED
eukprot:gene6550-10556_t